MIAIVDDDLGVREAVSLLLDVAGLKTESFSSAAAFLSAAPASFNRLILDQHMPDMTGLELAEKLRAAGIDTPIMLVSGALSPDIVRRARSLGIDPVVEKPATLEDFLAFIDGA